MKAGVVKGWNSKYQTQDYRLSTIYSGSGGILSFLPPKHQDDKSADVKVEQTITSSRRVISK